LSSSAGGHLLTYQDRDNEVIDYEMYEFHGHLLRGPKPKTISPGKYFSCLGAAQTFGRFCERPYPALLSEGLDLSALNLGFAGAGPRLFVGRPHLLRYANEGRFTVVQVMSARSEDNSRFDTGGREWMTRRSDGAQMGAEPAYRDLLENESPETVKEIIEETRENWANSYSALLEAIEVPTVLLWLSKRSPDYEESYADVLGLFGEFPQLVNRSMVERIKPFADEYVECVSARGSPQPLVSRFTGEPASVAHRVDLRPGTQEFNTYYPSPEMHADAAEALLESCRKYPRLQP
jgi:hypothetical protein